MHSEWCSGFPCGSRKITSNLMLCARNLVHLLTAAAAAPGGAGGAEGVDVYFQVILVDFVVDS